MKQDKNVENLKKKPEFQRIIGFVGWLFYFFYEFRKK